VLLNYFSDRIVDVGSLGLPDILEEGRPTVDVVVTARLGQRLRLRFQMENLGNQAIRFIQGGLDQRVFTLGRTFAVNVGLVGF
jgi:hypothetical protein